MGHLTVYLALAALFFEFGTFADPRDHFAAPSPTDAARSKLRDRCRPGR
ncbi:hypothetical protein [Embleya scabrispora]|nr:hypothetical protein [Embleya scabrispora]